MEGLKVYRCVESNPIKTSDQRMKLVQKKTELKREKNRKSNFNEMIS